MEDDDEDEDEIDDDLPNPNSALKRDNLRKTCLETNKRNNGSE